MNELELFVQPGVISALLFIFLDIFTVGILDIVLARLVCLAYYRNINEGKPVSVKSADIPGLSNYLLGQSFSLINIVALGTKLALLGVVLAANMSIQTRGTKTNVESRDATFAFDPTDEDREVGRKYKVRRRLETSKSCFEEKNDVLIYYPLRFNLKNGTILDGPDFPAEDSENEMYDVDDATVVCMSPSQVGNEEPLVTVLGCTRTEEEGQCLTVISRNTSKKVTINYVEGDTYSGEITHKYLNFDTDGVKSLWGEYANPVLTCLSTQIGVTTDGASSKYSHCLLVSVEYPKDSEVETIVERWILSPAKGDPDKFDSFVMEYPGIRFKGEVPFGKLAAAQYLELPFPFTDYRTLSGDLVAQASKYEYSPKRVAILEKVDTPVTVIGYWAVGMVVGSILIVVVGFIITVILLRKDTRPRFNTINGLSSIVREEHEPSGRSYTAGESAVLGLRFTNADSLHFGPLSSKDEGTAFQEGYDIS